MGSRGPAPQPTNLRVLRGNPSKRPLNKQEPQPRRGRPSCPRWLKGEGRKEWKRIVPELDRLGLLTYIDRGALAAYCQCYARWLEAEEIVEEEGLTFVTDKGYLQQRPEVGIAHKSLQLMKAFAADFGLTPASRTRLSVSRKPEEADPMEEFLARGRSN